MSIRISDNTGRHVRSGTSTLHDDVIKWKHFPRYWPFVRGIHRSPVNSPHKGQWRGALMLSLICTWINGWVNNGNAGDLRRYRAHYDVTVTRHDSRISHSPRCIRKISHNASFFNKNMHTCTHFCYKEVHCGIWYWGIVGFVQPVCCGRAFSECQDTYLSALITVKPLV